MVLGNLGYDTIRDQLLRSLREARTGVDCEAEADVLARFVILEVASNVTGELHGRIYATSRARMAHEVTDVNEAVHNAAVVAGMNIAAQVVDQYAADLHELCITEAVS